MKTKKTIYYKDELNDDFAGGNIKKRSIDEHYKYIHKNIFWKVIEFVLFWLFAYPIVWLYLKLILQVKFVNLKAAKKCKDKYFLYGNHTGVIDAYVPNIISSPRRTNIIVDPASVSIKGIGWLVEMFGATPIASTPSGMKNFLRAIDTLHKSRNITIYPEAHIWPYYTGVRPFVDTSFSYPAKLNSPIIAFFVAYSKPKGFLKFLRKANITVYVSDPFYPKQNIDNKSAQRDLRDKVYKFMLDKSKYSDYKVIEYIKKSE